IKRCYLRRFQVAKSPARADVERIGAKVADPLQNLLLRALPERYDADDGSRADNDAKHRQKSAEPMRIHRAKRHREGLVEPIPHPGKEPGPCRWLFHRHGRCGPLGFAVSRIRDDFAIANFNDALRAGSDLPVMRDDDDGASFAVELLKNAEDFFSAMTVKRAGWFVGKDDVRIVDQRAGDGNALLLSAGQL